ncbi:MULTISPECIES: hypothetical protein [unclassified Moorena]|uniref:hypothetical protein n=1 Tax=unclassified Moorena TaxID=2683338 RepID=UPI0013C90F90|nr:MULTISPECIES: hypothetical protein [unclassified Moorena]NEO22351.1 hypothetical protein [Moorena sp. SIO4A5]NEQ58422.1 hypothetical protein [Moorena sp. SIO4A1]
MPMWLEFRGCWLGHKQTGKGNLKRKSLGWFMASKVFAGMLAAPVEVEAQILKSD